jgi:thioredoxin-like negative regulator of GroEL
MLEDMTDTDFSEKVSQGICLVLFYKDLCPYCNTMKGVAEKFGAKNPTIKLLQINALENPETSRAFEVERFPDLIFFKDGQPTAARKKGLTNPQGLNELLSTI